MNSVNNNNNINNHYNNNSNMSNSNDSNHTADATVDTVAAGTVNDSTHTIDVAATATHAVATAAHVTATAAHATDVTATAAHAVAANESAAFTARAMTEVEVNEELRALSEEKRRFRLNSRIMAARILKRPVHPPIFDGTRRECTNCCACKDTFCLDIHTRERFHSRNYRSVGSCPYGQYCETLNCKGYHGPIGVPPPNFNSDVSLCKYQDQCTNQSCNRLHFYKRFADNGTRFFAIPNVDCPNGDACTTMNCWRYHGTAPLPADQGLLREEKIRLTDEPLPHKRQWRVFVKRITSENLQFGAFIEWRDKNGNILLQFNPRFTNGKISLASCKYEIDEDGNCIEKWIGSRFNNGIIALPEGATDVHATVSVTRDGFEIEVDGVESTYMYHHRLPYDLDDNCTLGHTPGSTVTAAAPFELPAWSYDELGLVRLIVQSCRDTDTTEDENDDNLDQNPSQALIFPESETTWLKYNQKTCVEATLPERKALKAVKIIRSESLDSYTSCANPGSVRIMGVVQDREIEVLPETSLRWDNPHSFHEVVMVTFPFEGDGFDCYRFHFTQSQPLCELVAKRLHRERMRESGCISIRGLELFGAK